MSELETISQQLSRASRPEEVFGSLSGDDPSCQAEQVTKIYKRLSKVVHPDRYQKDPQLREIATSTFAKLSELFEEAKDRIKEGVYGTNSPGKSASQPFLVRVGRSQYIVDPNIAFQGDLCNLYRCSVEVSGQIVPGIFKIPREPTDNDLVSNEARILRHLRSNPNLEKFHTCVPELLNTFSYTDDSSPIKRQVNILTDLSEFRSLEEVRNEYKEGVDPRDLAWMWRRLLATLSFTHVMGVVHGAILPPHVLIYPGDKPEERHLMIVDLSYAVLNPASTGEVISAIDTKYRDWYPKEVIDKKSPQPGFDIFMATRLAIYLLGGNPLTGELSDSIHPRLRKFFQGCLRTGTTQPEAFQLRKEFTGLMDDLWKRQFRPFSMPARKIS